MITREDVTSSLRMPEPNAGNTGVIDDITESPLEPPHARISCGIINILIVSAAAS